MSKLGQTFRLMVPAGKATPQPPVGSALGQRGLNLMNFCKAFNDQTAHLIQGTPMQVARPAVTRGRSWFLAGPASHADTSHPLTARLSRLSLTDGSLTARLSLTALSLTLISFPCVAFFVSHE